MARFSAGDGGGEGAHGGNAAALSILLLPFVAIVIVPLWLLTHLAGNNYWWTSRPLIIWSLRLGGAAFLVAGLVLFTGCVKLFAKVGRGTLAPWDPTRNLVGVGPYRLVRNPMIGAVALMLLGEALLTGSWALAVWVCVFVSTNHVYFVLLEEPGLERRFGDAYREYKAEVPRWVPKLRRPWDK